MTAPDLVRFAVNALTQHRRRTRREIAPNDGIRDRAQSSVRIIPCWRRLRRRGYHKSEYAEHGAPQQQRFGDLPGHFESTLDCFKMIAVKAKF